VKSDAAAAADDDDDDDDGDDNTTDTELFSTTNNRYPVTDLHLILCLQLYPCTTRQGHVLVRFTEYIGCCRGIAHGLIEASLHYKRLCIQLL
jgi:hypothetical protein